MKLIDAEAHLGDKVGTDGFTILRSQEITDAHLDALKQHKHDSASRPTGDWHRACSVPTALHETWLRQGYDMTKEPIRKTLLKLSAEGFDAFITTNRQL